jgi:FtsH-binding integral membrane protein
MADFIAGFANASESKEIQIDSKVTQEKKKLTIQDQRYRVDTWLRIGLAIWAAAVVSWWLSSVLAIIKNNNEIHCLSDAVLIALLGTTTINVIGLVIIVLNGLFPRSEKSS